MRSFTAPREAEISEFAASQSAPKQDGEHRPISFALQLVRVWRLQESTGLVDSEPVPKPHAQLLHPFDASNAACEFGAQQTGIGGLECKPSYGREPSIDCARCELTVLGERRLFRTALLLWSRSGSASFVFGRFVFADFRPSCLLIPTASTAVRAEHTPNKGGSGVTGQLSRNGFAPNSVIRPKAAAIAIIW